MGLVARRRGTSMWKYVYAAIIRPDEEDGGYWAEVPDLPGCYGQGDTYIDAIESASDGIETHLAALAEDDMPIPKATVVTADDGDVVYVYANTDNFSLGVPTMSATEAAKALGITKGRVSQLIASGKLVAERFAGRTQVTVDSVEAYAASDRSAGRPRKNASMA